MSGNIFVKRRKSVFDRIFSGLFVFALIFNLVLPPGYAQLLPQSILNLPAPGAMVSLSAGFTPILVKGITIHPDNPLRFDFILDRGDTRADDAKLREESTRLIKYFLASLTVPEDELWVNLSPDEKDRITSPTLGQTEMGRDMLAQDYILKQLTASLMYPEKELGQKFWDRVYKKAQEQFGTTEIPVNTFNKVWIVPDKAVVYQHGNSAFVVESRLKVMLEQDYEAMEQGTEKQNPEPGIRNSEVSTEIIREIIIPELEKEVNTGETFGKLRQIYNSMILAAWYKQSLRQSLLGQVYVNQAKIKGVDVEDKQISQKIYNQYLEAFKKGVYNYIREDKDPATHDIVPRKYFSGGVNASQLFKLNDGVQIEKSPTGLSAQQRRQLPEGGEFVGEVTLVEYTPGNKQYVEQVQAPDIGVEPQPIGEAKEDKIASSPLIAKYIDQYLEKRDPKQLRDGLPGAIKVLWAAHAIYFNEDTSEADRQEILEVIFKVLNTKEAEDLWKNAKEILTEMLVIEETGLKKALRKEGKNTEKFWGPALKRSLQSLGDENENAAWIGVTEAIAPVKLNENPQMIELILDGIKANPDNKNLIHNLVAMTISEMLARYRSIDNPTLLKIKNDARELFLNRYLQDNPVYVNSYGADYAVPLLVMGDGTGLSERLIEYLKTKSKSWGGQALTPAEKKDAIKFFDVLGALTYETPQESKAVRDELLWFVLFAKNDDVKGYAVSALVSLRQKHRIQNEKKGLKAGDPEAHFPRFDLQKLSVNPGLEGTLSVMLTELTTAERASYDDEKEHIAESERFGKLVKDNPRLTELLALMAIKKPLDLASQFLGGNLTLLTANDQQSIETKISEFEQHFGLYFDELLGYVLVREFDAGQQGPGVQVNIFKVTNVNKIANGEIQFTIDNTTYETAGPFGDAHTNEMQKVVDGAGKLKYLLKSGNDYTVFLDYLAQNFFDAMGIPVAGVALVRDPREYNKLKILIEFKEGYLTEQKTLPERFWRHPAVVDTFPLTSLLNEQDRASWNMLFARRDFNMTVAQARAAAKDDIYHIDLGASFFSKATGGFNPFPEQFTYNDFKRRIQTTRFDAPAPVNEAYDLIKNDGVKLAAMVNNMVTRLSNEEITKIVKGAWDTAFPKGEGLLDVDSWINQLDAELRAGWNRKNPGDRQNPINVFKKIGSPRGRELQGFLVETLETRRNNILGFFDALEMIQKKHPMAVWSQWNPTQDYEPKTKTSNKIDQNIQYNAKNNTYEYKLIVGDQKYDGAVSLGSSPAFYKKWKAMESLAKGDVEFFTKPHSPVQRQKELRLMRTRFNSADVVEKLRGALALMENKFITEKERSAALRVLADNKDIIPRTLEAQGYVDLHQHTFISDGYRSPESLVFRAWRAGIRVLGTSDHDTLNHVEEILAAAEMFDVQYLPAVEINLYDDSLDIDNYHLLAYFPNYQEIKNTPAFAAFRQKLAGLVANYNARIEAFRLKFNGQRENQQNGLELTPDDAAPYLTTGAIRHQLGDALLAKYGPARLGLPGNANFLAVTAKYFSKESQTTNPGATGYVPIAQWGRDGLNTPEILSMIKNFNGVAVVAHPVELKAVRNGQEFQGAAVLEPLLNQYPDLIQGVEIYAGKHLPEFIGQLNALVARINRGRAAGRELFFTIGSDSHDQPARHREIGLGEVSRNNPQGNIPRDISVNYQNPKLGIVASSPVEDYSNQNDSTPVGGINLDPKLLDLQIKRDGKGVPLPLPFQPIQNMRIDGFIPVIINITPISNLPFLLGIAGEEESTDLGYNVGIGPIEHKERFKMREQQEAMVLN